MRELELDGIHDDGEHVVLIDSDGERYTLRIDKALRAAVRTDRPALNMIQAAESAPLRPREIQAMLRSGRSAEEIAEVSEIPVDHVRRYEGPVLAEREWTAQRAKGFPVGRGGPAVDEVAAERLAAREATGESAWDAWRRSDGTWTLELTFAAGGRTRQAHWVADMDSRTVSPIDDEARWISDEDAPSEPARGRGRLQAVKSSVYDLEADGSLDGPEHPSSRPRTWPARGLVSGEHPSTLDESELDALNARRGLRSVPPLGDEEEAAVWSGLDEEPAEDPSAAPEGSGPEGGSPSGHGESDPDEEAEREHAADPGTASAGAEDAPEQGEEPGDGAQDDPEDTGSDAAASLDPQEQETVDLTPLPGFDEASEKAAEEAPAKKPARSRNKRQSMPSWDEIVFGSKHD